jgi:hypothetical protein
MRIRISSAIADMNHEKPAFEATNADLMLRVRVEHDGVKYELCVDRDNHLTLRALDGAVLVLEPAASNEMRIDARAHWRKSRHS